MFIHFNYILLSLYLFYFQTDQYLVKVISSPNFDHSSTAEYVHVVECSEGAVVASATVTVSLIQNVAPTFTNDHSKYITMFYKNNIIINVGKYVIKSI